MPRSHNASMSLIMLLLMAACAQTLIAQAEEASGANPELLNNIIQRMEEAQLQNRARVRPYTVIRDYVVYGSDPDEVKGHVVAQVNFLPPNRKSYEIAESTGGFHEKVVRRVLEHEVEVTRDPQHTWLTSRNYEFQLLGEQQLNGRRCYVLKTHPKRPDKDLLKANLWIDADSYRIRRIDGEPNKNPSFWVKEVHLILDFGDVAGMWLQTHTEAIARVRFAGDYKMYSRDMRYETAPVVATAAAKSTASGNTNSHAPSSATATNGKGSTFLTANAVPAHRTHASRHTAPFIAGVWNSR